MSNGYKDMITDRRAEFNAKMWEAAYLYDGWHKAFVPQMMDELFDALGSYVEDFEVLQIKEKYSKLVIYWNWDDRDYTDEERADLNELYEIIENIIKKYSDISDKTCVECGGKATYFSTGWTLPYCDSCRDKSKGVFAIIDNDKQEE